MKSIVDQLCEKAGVQIQSEVSDWTKSYHMIQGGSPECEVLEFLYGLVCIAKPKRILETGTYAGFSSAVLALNGAEVTTLEIDEYWVNQAKILHEKLGLSTIRRIHKASLDYEAEGMYDLLFLDSEPDIRFKELAKFFPNLKQGGFAVIHDLHNHLGLSNQTLHNMEHWPFGSFKQYFGQLILEHKLTVLNFSTPRGFTLFQKFSPDYMNYKYLTGQEPR